MQRLFSTFPNSWPGLGLLVLRFATGLSLTAVADMVAGLSDTASLFARCAVTGAAILICIGLWTPLAALAAVAIQIVVIIFAHQFNMSLAVSAAAALSLAMLGPGSWSIDARLFGRKRIL